MTKHSKESDGMHPTTDICRDCGVEYPLDWSLAEEYGDELRPIRGYCPEHSGTKGNHQYPGI